MSGSGPLRALPRRLARFARLGRGHPRLLGASVAAAAATAAATVASRRHRPEAVRLPNAAAVAAETAMSVHDAAKATMLLAARTADSPDLDVIIGTAQEVVTDAIEAGVDLVPVAIGVADGAASVAHLFDRTDREVVLCAATASVQAAAVAGATAAGRVEAAFADIRRD